MTKKTTYREAILPGIGRLWVPAEMTDAEVRAQIEEADQPAAKKGKTKKKS